MNQMLVSLNHPHQLVSLATHVALSIVPSPPPFTTAFITCCTRSTSRTASGKGSVTLDTASGKGSVTLDTASGKGSVTLDTASGKGSVTLDTASTKAAAENCNDAKCT